MKKTTTLLILLILIFQGTYSESKQLKLREPRKGEDQWFTQPKVGEEAHDGWFKTALYRADKKRTNERFRYRPHVSHRDYLDCSYYKYVNCQDIRFCRCWQCKDYFYSWEFTD